MSGSKLSLTILSDNNAAECCTAEHGFAIVIDTGTCVILFDTGKEGALLPNAASLGVDLSGVERLVLSHGHYDHTGGICEVLALAPEASVYLHPAALQKRYSIRQGIPKPTSMPENAVTMLSSLPDSRMNFIEQPCVLPCGAGITGPVPRQTGFEDTGGPFYLDTEGACPDPIIDDLSIWMETREGLVLVAGCCHAGIVNTLRYVTELTGTSRIAALIGGFHLSAASSERLSRTVEELNSFDIGRIIPCHCTGETAALYFRRNLHCPVDPGYAGMKMEFPL
ncbi:MAG: MBL fold metallo-hydrolase [Chlorobium sp.]|jgi:7,8-dihydropterin-6-yl-methyl-4-(beta-D-ribofuranosyl)aminobenzene 5'-phosphate synthase|uniref:MBL fold metallo-hydrolase n=1 Tax=Chlorobium sp. TaxID=1095 RepID=UPI001DA04B07|nr:MBL fold metallo-hydrolase [Chlorobium sp.]MBN1278605.1 MBL fold metallo-hydrolase [Chlorobiaceae bacterium]MCF8216696.1 MBL fold metallo-hydrolase [Chlorobium sp.]MCF8271583.1 MBL fold metallo-hydrolase [Chlorobium sp.]MCF8287936.1 MBL fold metallo-hydrolase [Chlorobium sp.]MCF8291481.1 MBL fold metallo-hydrolase [Chlorobium sp.]